MSSFLMNPVSTGTGGLPYQQPQHHQLTVADPKFPPNEEYSQSNYIQPGGEPFAGHLHHHHHLNQHHLQYGYHHNPAHHHQNAYGMQVNGGYAPYGYGYHSAPTHHHQLHQHHQQHQPTQLRNAGNSMQQHPDAAACSPVSAQHECSSSASPPGPAVGATIPLQELGMRLDRRIEEAAPTGQQLQELGMHLEEPPSDQDDLDDDRLMMDGSPAMDDDDDHDDSENGDRVIYPWMKKIHVAGVGEFYI